MSDPAAVTDYLRTAYRELRVRSGLPATARGYAADSVQEQKRREDAIYADDLITAHQGSYAAQMAKADASAAARASKGQ